jgi:hypothetical protein
VPSPTFVGRERTVSEGTQVRTHLCGIRTAWTEAPEAELAVGELARAIGPADLSQIVVFFSSDYCVEALNRALAEGFPGVPVAGCTMSG